MLRRMRTSSAITFGTGCARDAAMDPAPDLVPSRDELLVEDVPGESEAGGLFETPLHPEVDFVVGAVSGR